MEKFIAEFIGTMVLVTLNNAVVANVLLKKTKGSNEGFILITLGAGLAVTFGIYVSMFRSGAHINPAVTISILSLGGITLSTALGYIVSQILGGITGALIVYATYKQHYDISDNAQDKLATFSTNPQIRHRGWNVLTEIIATFFLVFVVLTVTSSAVTLSDELIPIVIGTLVFVLGISLGGPTGFAMNPARDLGPRITHSLLRLGDSDWKYAMIPVVGPIIGGLIAALVFNLYI